MMKLAACVLFTNILLISFCQAASFVSRNHHGRSSFLTFRGGDSHRMHKPDTTTELLGNDEDIEQMLADELENCEGEIIDAHLHTAPWFDDSETLVAELEASNVSVGLLYNPYPKVQLPYDINTYVTSIAASSKGRVYALASLNTTHDDWESNREFEMDRLKSFLTEKHKSVLGAKLAPPHTCLPLQGPVMDDVVEAVHQSAKKLLAIHIGTTPFCGPLGEQFGVVCNCTEDHVNPALLIPKIESYPDVTFCLLHSGHEFLPKDSPYYYDFKFSDECIAMAKTYPNVYLSISALFAQSPDGTLKYPGGVEIVKRMKEQGVTHKVFWGSDASYFQGQIRPVLMTAIKAMIDGGWTKEERAWTLRGCARHVFKIPATE
mmetsp:Transcript_9956/g.15354  ORF Transcript_9956/g.15354 Transcript_9956/m.15354 type:complete len:376 (+) Transcript_9956:107-1234(+)